MRRLLAFLGAMAIAPVAANAAPVTFSESIGNIFVNSVPHSSATPFGTLIANGDAPYFGCIDGRYCDDGYFNIKPQGGKLLYSQGGDQAYTFSGEVISVNYTPSMINLLVRAPFRALTTDSNGQPQTLFQFGFLKVTLGNLVDGKSSRQDAGLGYAPAAAGTSDEAYALMVGVVPVPASGLMLVSALAAGSVLRRRRKDGARRDAA